jgi:hypothetical protein
MFVGHPLVAIGCALGAVALARRMMRERSATQALERGKP